MISDHVPISHIWEILAIAYKRAQCIILKFIYRMETVNVMFLSQIVFIACHIAHKQKERKLKLIYSIQEIKIQENMILFIYKNYREKDSDL